MRNVSLGLSFVELVLVLCIFSIVAMVVVPQFSQASNDPRGPVQHARQCTIQNAINQYCAEHNGMYPDSDNLIYQLTLRTDDQGRVMPHGAAGSDYPCGPYLSHVPVNPFTIKTSGDTVSSASHVEGNQLVQYGWQYQASTGKIIPSNVASSDS